MYSVVNDSPAAGEKSSHEKTTLQKHADLLVLLEGLEEALKLFGLLEDGFDPCAIQII